MNVEDTIARPDMRSAESGIEAYSQAWWHARSTDELRLIMSRGFELGPAFDGAMAEAERRACERLKAEERAAVERETRNRGFRRIILEGLVLACLLALIAGEMMR